MDMEELGERVERIKETIMIRQKEKYRYARDHGFTGAEAAVLQNQSWETINQLVEERHATKG